jgi:hypothetical protein
MEAAVGVHEFSQHQSRAEKILVEAEQTRRRTPDTESLQNYWPYKGCHISSSPRPEHQKSQKSEKQCGKVL